MEGRSHTMEADAHPEPVAIRMTGGAVMCVAEINLFSCNRCLWIYRMQWLCLHDRMNLCRKFRAEITDCGGKENAE